MMWCKGPTITKGQNRVVSGIRIQPVGENGTYLTDLEFQKRLNEVVVKDIDNLFDDPEVKGKHKHFQDWAKSQTGLSQQKDFFNLVIQKNPIPIIVTLKPFDIAGEKTASITFTTVKMHDNEMFGIYLNDNRDYIQDIDHVKLLNEIASSIKLKQ